VVLTGEDRDGPRRHVAWQSGASRRVWDAHLFICITVTLFDASQSGRSHRRSSAAADVIRTSSIRVEMLYVQQSQHSQPTLEAPRRSGYCCILLRTRQSRKILRNLCPLLTLVVCWSPSDNAQWRWYMATFILWFLARELGLC
jgi:hypothetical protein